MGYKCGSSLPVCLDRHWAPSPPKGPCDNPLNPCWCLLRRESLAYFIPSSPPVILTLISFPTRLSSCSLFWIWKTTISMRDVIPLISLGPASLLIDFQWWQWQWGVGFYSASQPCSVKSSGLRLHSCTIVAAFPNWFASFLLQKVIGRMEMKPSSSGIYNLSVRV